MRSSSKDSAGNLARQPVSRLTAWALVTLFIGLLWASTVSASGVPSVSISVGPDAVRENSGAPLVYTLTRSPTLPYATVVSIGTSGTAVPGLDFTGHVDSVVIPAGEDSATIEIRPVPDGLIEADKTVILQILEDPEYIIDLQGSATGTLLNDDMPTATFVRDADPVTEDGTDNLTYTVTITPAPLTATSVNFTVAGTGTAGTDYATVPSPLVFAAGQGTGTITINPTADTFEEGDETVVVTLVAGTGYVLTGPRTSASGVIRDDEPPVLVVEDAGVQEGQTGTIPAVFIVRLNRPAGVGGVTFDIATSDGTAIAGPDYVGKSLVSQTIPAGSRIYGFVVIVNGDASKEQDENYFVNITNVTGAVVGDGQGQGTIIDDDPRPSLSIDDTLGAEGQAGTINATFNVRLSAASGQPVTVDYATVDGTAVAPEDYAAASGTLTFVPGQVSRTITVAINGDTTPEENETFKVELSGATNATLADASGNATLFNDDVPITLSPDSMPNATVGAAYSQAFGAEGGEEPYRFTVSAGALPPGLGLSSTGVLSGTATAGGIFNFTVTAQDGSPPFGPYSGSRTYTLAVDPPTLALRSTPLANGTQGVHYAVAITGATDGTAPYTYAVTAGALPDGLALYSELGAITGVPSTRGTFTFSITATDSSTGTGPYRQTQTYQIIVVDLPPVANAVSINVPYSASATNVGLTIAGGVPTSVAIASAPANGSATATGISITYQPIAGYIGPDSFTYTATNSGGTSVPATVSVEVSVPAIRMSASESLSATVGVAYTQTFTWIGGMPPWRNYLVTDLPAGLSVSGTTANSVTVSGTPIQAGGSHIVPSAVDSSTGQGPVSVGQAFTLIVTDPRLTLLPAAGTISAAYGAPISQAFAASGGIGPYTYTHSGALPPGVSLTDNTVSGTPTAPGSYTVAITATDTGFTGVGAPISVTQNYTFDVTAPSIVITPAALSHPDAGTVYSEVLTASGGVAPYSFEISSGALPSGLSLSVDGTLSGTSTQVGTFNVTVIATDANGQIGSRDYSLDIAAPTLTMTPAANTLTAPYGVETSQSFSAAGSAGAFDVVLTGALPAGMTFSGNTLSGTPTAPGSYPISVTATDTALTGAGAPFSITQNYTLDVPAPGIAVAPTTLANPIAGTAYSQTITATGGVGPYRFALTNGTLPAGLTLTSDGAFSGTATEVGTFTPTITATDGNGQTGRVTVTLVVAVPMLTLTPPAGTLTASYGDAYSQTFTAAGNAGPVTFVLTGALPAGVTFSGSTLSGTPIAPGSYSISITATDAVLTGAGAPFSTTQNYTLDVTASSVVITPATLSNPDAGIAYSQALTASGGVAPYSFAISSGALPLGLSLSADGTLSGTSNQVGAFAINVTATDANGQTGSGAYALDIAAPTLTMTPAAGTLTAPYGVAASQTFTAAGSAGPFDVVLTGALPTGMTFSNNTLSGTPIAPGNYPISITATDTLLTGAGAPFSMTRNYTLYVPAPGIVITPATLANPVSGAAYRQTLTAAGGVGPYRFALTTGTLPAGLALTTDGVLSGTATQVGTFAPTITTLDGNGQTGSRTYTLVVAAAMLTLAPAAGTLIAPYSEATSQTFTAAGSDGPFDVVLTGALPAGMSFRSNTLSGAPTVPGNYPITVTATDTRLTGAGAPFSITHNYTLVVPAPGIVVAPATLPGGTAGQAYSQTLSATGAVGPYGFTASAGALPNGLALSADGTLSGTPTTSGTFNLTVVATDTHGQVGTRAYGVVVAAPTLSLTPTTLPSGTVGIAYSQALSTAGGIAPYRYAVTAGTLPGGLTLAADGTLSGTPITAGTFNATITATDSTAGSAATVSQAVAIQIVFAPPVAANDTATVLAGQAVTIAVSANDVSAAPITSIAIATPPGQGTAVVSGLSIVYTAPTNASPTVSFTYVASSAGGTSAPATVMVTVNPLPVAPTLTATTPPSTPVQVTLTTGAAGGPFTGANVAAVSPAGSGTTSIAASGSNYLLTFTPATAFSGVAVVRYTLNNAFATSDEGTVTITVQPRPDPSRDSEVRGLIDAQVESTRRFASGQISNFQQRLERLHDGGDGGFDNRLGFALDRACIEPRMGDSTGSCNPSSTGFRPGEGLANDATGATASTGRGAASPIGVWVGGMIRSGSQDGRNGGADIVFETDGVSTGLDVRLSEDVAIGGGLGFGKDENAVGDAGSRVDGFARTAAVYASYHPGKLFVDTLLGFQTIDYDLRRHVGANGQHVGGQRGADQWFGSVSVGRDIVRDNMTLTPYGSLDMAKATLDGYTETGDAIYALTYDAMDVDKTVGNLGLRLDWHLTKTWGRVTPQLRLEYQHDVSGRSEALMRYTDLMGGPVYGLSARGVDNNRFTLGLGVLLDLDNGWGWSLHYRGLIGSDGESDSGINLNVQKPF